MDCDSDSVLTVRYEEKGDNNRDYSQSISELFPESSTTTTNRPGIIKTLKNTSFKSDLNSCVYKCISQWQNGS